MTNKVVIRNAITDELEQKYGVKFKKDIQKIESDKIFDSMSPFYLPLLPNTAFLVCGYEEYLKVRKLCTQQVIHMGLRSYTYDTVKNIPVVRISNGIKFIFTDGIINKSVDWDKVLHFINGNLDVEPPKLKEFDVLDLKDAKIGLEKLKLLNIADEYLGLDFESVDFPLTKSFHPLGLSIVGSNYGFYVDIRNYQDYHDPIYSDIRKFIEDNYKRIVVFNCNFEIRAIDHMWQEFLLFNDTWALMIEADTRRGLKPSAQEYLGVPSWDSDLEEEQLFFNKLMHGGTYKGEEWDPCPDVETFFQRLNDHRYAEKYSSNLSRIMQECINRRIEEQNIKDEDIFEFSRMVKQGYKDRIQKWWGSEWAMCDAWTLGKYCCYDSYYTKLIWDKMYKVYPRANEPYHNNFYYGAFLETTGIPINQKKLHTLKRYLDKVHINTGIFYLKFYLKCLEDIAGEYVDSLQLNEYSRRIIVDYPWMMSLPSDKVLKELLKVCSTDDVVGWKRYAQYIGVDLAREVWNLVKNDIDKNTGTFTVASACRKHRNDWIALGQKFEEISAYKGLIERINERNLEISRPAMAKFNQDIKEWVSPLNPNHTKIVAQYFNSQVKDENGKKVFKPWLAKKEHPETSPCYDFVENVHEEWDKEYNNQQYLEGKKFKKLLAYITKEDLERWKHSFNFHQEVPAILLRELPFEVISAEQVFNLIQLRNLKPILDKWDNVKVDDDLPEGVSRDMAEWLAFNVVQWGSDKKYFIVVITMLQKYGWLCSAITQFWNYWWSPEHDKSQDLAVLSYAIENTKEYMEAWEEDAREYIYQSGDNYKKAERSVGLENFSKRFGFENPIIRQWREFNVDKNSTLSIEKNDDKLIEDWDNLYKFFIYWDMGMAAEKQINPYVDGMINSSFKLDRVLSDGSEVIDYSQHGERFMTRFKICGVA